MAKTQPMYSRIADELRGEIARGVLAPGAQLPSEAELGQRFDVSRNTVRLALGALQNEGLIITGSGQRATVRNRATLTFRASHAESVGRPASGGDSFTAEVTSAGRKPTQSFSMRIEPAGPEVAARLNIEENSLVVMRRMVRYVDGQAWSDQDSWYPMDVAQAAGLMTPADIPQGTVRAMADAGFHEQGWSDEITSRMPAPDEAQALDVGQGIPLMVYVRTAYTDSRPVRVTRSLFPGDRNRILYELGDLSADVDATQ